MGSMGEWLSGAAGAWLRWMGAMSWQVAILVIVVFIISLAARKASPRFRFFLWSLVLIKLCLPPHLSFVTGLGHWLPVTAPAQVQFAEMPASVSALTSVTLAPVSLPPIVPTSVAMPPVAPVHHIAMPVILFAIWTLAALGVLLVLVVQYLRLKRLLADAVMVDAPAVLEVMNDAKRRLGVKRDVPLFVAKGITSPILFGLLKQRIILPEDALSDLPPAQLRPILLHELSHFKRRDLWLNWAQAALQAVYWFHPLVWVANVYLRREREMIVDDMVLAHLDGPREDYGDSLLSVVKSASRPRILAAGYVGVMEGRGRIMQRIRRIVDSNRKVSLRLGVVSGVILVVVALTLIPLAQRKAEAAQADAKKAEVTKTAVPQPLTVEGTKLTINSENGRTTTIEGVGDSIRMTTSAVAVGESAASSAVTEAIPPRQPALPVLEFSGVVSERNGAGQNVLVTGSVVSNLDVDIKCMAGGQVKELPFDVGDTVKKGDLLVALDTADAEQDLKFAESTLEASQLRVEELRFEQAELDKQAQQAGMSSDKQRADEAVKLAETELAETEYNAATAKAIRTKEQADAGRARTDELDSANVAVAKAQANWDAAQKHRDELNAASEVAVMKKRQDCFLAEATVRTDEINYLNARRRLEGTRVISPMDAVVVARNVQVGQIVPGAVNNSGGVTMLTLSDLSRIFVVASVGENDIGKVRAGAPVDITSDAYPRVVFRGQVSRIAVRATRVSGIATFEVKMEVTSPNKNLLKPGMSACVVMTPAEEGARSPTPAPITKEPGPTPHP